jgi:RNA polymerase sigma-70 factor (ECF subfamily)
MPQLDQSHATNASFLGLDTATGSNQRTSVREQLRQIFEEQRDRVYRYLRALGASPTDGEELTQEAFLRLFRYLRDGGKVNDNRAWLLRVAHNLWREEGRIRARRPEEALDTSDFLDPRPDPESRCAERQRDLRLRQAMEQLTELQRSALYLRSEGLSYREAASVLGVGVSTVAAAVRRAVEKLGRLANE